MRIIALEGMQFFANHGYYDEEQIIGNHYVLDVFIGIDFTDHLDDDLNKTINYETVFLICKQVMAQPARLLETILNNIADKLKLHFKNIRTLKIKIQKIGPPLGGQVSAASIIDSYDFKKVCPSCGDNLSCYKSDSCECFNVALDNETLSKLNQKYNGCLCMKCLKKESNNS